MNRNDEEFLVQKIRTEYMEKENTQLDELKKLDIMVKRPANIFAYGFGSLGALIMGSGMSLIMTDIGSVLGLENVTVPGIAIGVLGLFMAIVNYPIYKKMLSSRRRQYASEVMRLSDKIMSESR